MELDEDMFAAPAPAAAAPNGNGDGTYPAAAEEGVPAADGEFVDAAPAEGAAFDDASAFLGGWAQSPTAAAAPVLAPAPPTQEDPRLKWQSKHNAELMARDKEESALKQAVVTKAKEHIGKFYESRKSAITSRRKDNRTDAEPEADVTQTGWAKVTALVNLGSSSTHIQDVTRYKETLVACKTRNVAIRT